MVGDSACRKNRSEPERPDRVGRTQHIYGMHNIDNGSFRESEGLIVALKRGNSRGVKGPYHKYALNKNNGDRLSMTTTECKVHCLRTKLANKAKQEPNFRFYNLYGKILRMDLLMVAWSQVKRNGGGAGIDNVSLKSFDSEEKVMDFLTSIQMELKEKTYRPQPVKRVYIPKPNGKLRPLGIPTVRDRVVQGAVKLLLEPIFEADFHECSYGFRPDRSAHQALDQIREALKGGKQAVYDADLKGCFDSIPHDKLMSCLRMRIVDRSILNLIKMWLKAPVSEETNKGRGPKVTYPKKGTPQGGVLSPLLANIYLHWFDEAFHRVNGPAKWAGAKLIRYADDFVILAKYQSERLQQFVEAKLESWLGLEINQEKTKVIDLGKGDSFKFLGYTFSNKRSLKERTKAYLCMEPSKQALQGARDSINEILDTSKGLVPIRVLVAELNRFLQGWGNYFSKGYPRMAKRKLNDHTRIRLMKHVRRRSQRPYRPPEGMSYYILFKKLGLEYL